jgi:hypothetical protein
MPLGGEMEGEKIQVDSVGWKILCSTFECLVAHPKRTLEQFLIFGGKTIFHTAPVDLHCCVVSEKATSSICKDLMRRKRWEQSGNCHSLP